MPNSQETKRNGLDSSPAGETSREFNEAARGERNEARERQQQGDGSEMVRQDRIEPEYPAPSWRGAADRAAFEGRMLREDQSHAAARQHEATTERGNSRDRVSSPLKDDFNRVADEPGRDAFELDKARDLLREAGELDPFDAAERRNRNRNMDRGRE